MDFKEIKDIFERETLSRVLNLIIFVKWKADLMKPKYKAGTRLSVYRKSQQVLRMPEGVSAG